MESLPTELLVRILGLAASGATDNNEGALLLLDVVPLVCHRWRAVCRDPACWAGVEVALESCHEYADDDEELEEGCLLAGGDDDHRRIASAARALLYAPCLRKLGIFESSR